MLESLAWKVVGIVHLILSENYYSAAGHDVSNEEFWRLSPDELSGYIKAQVLIFQFRTNWLWTGISTRRVTELTMTFCNKITAFCTNTH